MAWREADLARTIRQTGCRVAGGEMPSLPDDTTESALLAKIREVAKPWGFLVYHTYRSTKSEPGFPDLVLTDGVSLIFAELKSNKGTLTYDQRLWLSTLQHTEKVEAYVWTPRDWPTIVERLTRRKR